VAQDSYTKRLEAAAARRAADEAARQEVDARRWRERLLSADELAEYERLQAAAKLPPRNLGNRAALPVYLLFVPQIAVIAGLLFPVLNREIATSMSATGRVTNVVLLLGVMFGGFIWIGALAGRRVRAAVKAYEDACATSVREYLDSIGYSERLRKAELQAEKDSNDYNFDPRRVHPERWGR
jgi:hypothetical protein